MSTTQKHIATIAEQHDDVTEINLEIFAADSIYDTYENDAEPVEAICAQTTATTIRGSAYGPVDDFEFDQVQFMADAEAALAGSGWAVTDWIGSDGDSGAIIGAVVVPISASQSTATIKQSAEDWNYATINISDEEVCWLESTAHAFHEVEGVSELADFNGDQWQADIDAALSEAGYTRVGELQRAGDFVQTCKVVPA